MYIFPFTRYCQFAPQKISIYLPFYQQCMKVSSYLNPQLVSNFLIFVILIIIEQLLIYLLEFRVLFFGEKIIYIFHSFLHGNFGFFLLIFISPLYILDTSYILCMFTYPLSACGLSFSFVYVILWVSRAYKHWLIFSIFWNSLNLRW